MNARIELLDPGAPGVDAALLDALLAAEDHRRIVVIGDRKVSAWLSNIGFEVLGRVAAPPGEKGMSSWLVGRRVRRRLESLVDLHHTTVGTWSESALSALLLAGVPAVSIDPVVVAAEGPSLCPPLASRLLGATPRSEVKVRAVGQAAGPALSRRGWTLGPAIDPRQFKSTIPSVVHRDPGAEDVDLVVGLAASPPGLGDARFACEAMVSLAAAGCTSELVVSSRARGVVEAARWITSVAGSLVGKQPRLRIDDRIERAGDLASEIDIVLVTAPRGGHEVSSALNLRVWLASGVPAIAPDDRTLRGLVQDGVDARVVPPADRNAVVRALIRMAEDRELREEMGHAAAARHAHRDRRVSGRSTSQASGSVSANPRAASR